MTKMINKEFYSETQYYTLLENKGNLIIVKMEDGSKLELPIDYVKNQLVSASSFTKEEKLTRTDLAAKFINASNTAITVCFNKQIKAEDVISEIMNTHQNTAPKDVEKEFKKTIKKALEGEERIMIGRHYGQINEFGRVQFIDMEKEKDTSKSYDTRLSQVDPRTIQWLIYKETKYILK